MKRLTYEQVKQSFEVEGYTLVSTEYVNSREKIKYICPNLHRHSITWGNWSKGRRCKLCSKWNNVITYETVKRSFENEGYTLLSTEYTGNMIPLHFECQNNHKHSITWANWNRGHRCGRCFGNIEVTYEQIKQSFESEGYTLLSTEYNNSNAYLYYICPHENSHKITWNNWNRGDRCPCHKCCKHPGTSKPEREIQAYIKEHHSDIAMVPNDRTMIMGPKSWPLELDVWMPEIKKAIEYGADYYHSDEYKKQCDDIKVQWCKNNGIPLLVIDHNKWIKNKDFSIISSFINCK